MAIILNGTTGITTPDVDSTADISVNGLTVGRGAGAISSNTALGSGALNANTTGTSNTASGSGALQNNTTGSTNTANGVNALRNNTTGNNNTASGFEALQNNTTGSNNVASGYQALRANTTGSYNTANGNSALFSNTTGDFNTASGVQALYYNTTGINNTASGRDVLLSNTTGSYNTASGQDALRLNTTGTSNTASGQGALQANTTASEGVAVGYKALEAVTTGVNNTAIGANSGRAVTTSDRSTFVGNLAGQATTGRANSFFGCDSGYLITSGAENTIIGRYSGNQNGLDIRTSSNNIVLSDGDGNPRASYFNVGTYRSWIFTQQATAVYQNASDVIQVDSNAYGNGIRVTGTSGTSALRFYNQSVPAIVGSISFTGSSTSYNTSSDYRLKNTVAPMTGALAKVALLKPVTYKWNADGSNGEGFIAHELAEVCPHAVTGKKDAVDEDGNPEYQGIDTSFLVATLTAALQELNAKFDAYVATHP